MSRLERALGILLVAALATVAVAAVAAAADEHDGLPSQPVVDGKQVFARKGCVQCHDVLGAGERRIGPDLGRGRSWRDAMQLAGELWNHTPAMLERMRGQGIARPALSPSELGALSAFLLASRFVDEPGDVERGRTAFEARSCVSCHQLEGRGGTLGPRLDELAPQMSSLFLAQALWNHGPEMAAKMAEAHVERPRLEGRDVADIVAFVRGPGRAAPSTDEIMAQLGSPRAGKAVFAVKGCVKCHAVAGGGATVGPDLATGPPLASVGDVAAALWNHGPAMWRTMGDVGVRFPRINGPEMSDLLAYLYFVQYMDERGDAARGAQVFRDKSCASCHVATAAGASVGPDLSASKAMRSPLDWASAMWIHAPAMAEKLRERGTPWPHFAGDDMRDLVAFLRKQRGAR
jgi:cytochrome c2